MVAGRVIAETLVASVAVVILIVILGLRYLNGTISGSSNQGDTFLNTVTSPLFLTLLLLLIFAGIAVVEFSYRRSGPLRRAESG